MKDAKERYNEAVDRMERRFSLGAQQEQMLLDTVAKTVIVDKLVPPKSMDFPVDSTGVKIRYAGELVCSIHRHALNQLCSKVKLPMSYVDLLLAGKDSWKKDLLAYNLESLFSSPDWVERGGEPTRFLHRIVGNELRGFLSRRFNRHLASAPLLRAFIDQCVIEGARPVEASSSPVRNALKCLLPTVFEAFPGEYICTGVEWSNSDFGSGKLKVLQTVWRVTTGTAAVLDEGLSRAHIGSVIEESDIEMSDATARKEVEAQQGAVRDHVKEYLAEKTVGRLLTAIRAAHEEAIPWAQLRSRLRDVVGKGDLDWLQQVLDKKGESIIDLPPISYAPDGAPTPNRYWASSALSALASKADDTDRRLELQREAGKLLAAALVAT
jgi:hypothetical protein